MRKERKNIGIDRIQLNTGQLDWLPRNPRTWTQEDIDRTAASIEEDPDFLEERPILVVPFGKEYVAFGGNLRHEGCAKLGRKTAPCVVYYPESEEDYETVKRRAMKDNGSFGAWDYDALANEWDDLPLVDWGVPAWEGEQPKKEEKEAKEDNFDEKKDCIKVLCKPGDIWELGEHRLMCGDSIDLQQVKTLMGGAEADLVVTDPPYGVSYVGINAPNGKEWDMIENDDLRGEGLRTFLEGAFNCIAHVLKKDGAFYIWFATKNHIEFESAIKAAGLRVKQELIWDKGMVLGRCDYHWAYEPCFYGTHEGENCIWYGDRKQKTFLAYNKTQIREMKKEQMEEILIALHNGRNCWKIDRDFAAEYLHPTQKPVEVMARAMRNSSCAQQIVLDLFGGSGTTLIAAEQMGRRARVMELDPHYCDVIIARWEKLTGQTAIKVN